MLRAVTVALLLLGHAPVSAEEMWLRTPQESGLWLSDVCRSNEATDKLFCMGYIRGLNAGQAMTVAVGGGKRAYCRDDKTVTIEQMRRVIAKYADDNPADLNLPSSVFAYSALARAFPCPPPSE